VKEVVPFVCHLCKGEFEAQFGGMCHHCHKPTCNDHLKKTSEKENTHLCDECIKATGVEAEKKEKRWYEKKIF